MVDAAINLTHFQELHEYGIPIERSKDRHKQFRREILNQFEGRCGYCYTFFGADFLTLDHIIPKFSGGGYVRHNLIAACAWCNHKKGSQDVFQFLQNRINYRDPKTGKHWTPEDVEAAIHRVLQVQANRFTWHYWQESSSDASHSHSCH